MTGPRVTPSDLLHALDSLLPGMSKIIAAKNCRPFKHHSAIRRPLCAASQELGISSARMARPLRRDSSSIRGGVQKYRQRQQDRAATADYERALFARLIETARARAETRAVAPQRRQGAR